VSIVMWQT